MILSVYMKKLIALSITLLAISGTLFAGGTTEEEITGEITGIENSPNGNLLVTITNSDGVFTVQFSEADWNSFNLQDGDAITVSGLAIDVDDDEFPEIEAATVQVGNDVYYLRDDDE